MNPFDELPRKWSRFGFGKLTARTYDVALCADDIARLQKICEYYPRLERAEIIRDLLSAALLDMEQSIPYEKGRRVIATDEWGDEIYEDSGLTPRYLKLARYYRGQLLGETSQSGVSARR